MFWQLLLVFWILAPAMAAEELAPIEVTAEKAVTDFYFGDSENIGDEELNSAPLGLVSSSIKETPGVVATQNGGPGGRVSYFIRGTEARHVSFTIDGLKINDVSNTDRQFDAAFVTSPFLKEVEIHKGPQAVLFGSDALGGLIEMKTRKGENAPEKRLSLGGGSFGTMNASLSGDWKNEENQGTLTISTFRSDGISRLNKKRFHATERDSSDGLQLTSSSSHRWRPDWQSDILLSWLRGSNELDGASDDNSHDEGRNDQYLAQVKTTHEINENSAISLRNGLSRHQRRLETLAAGENSYEGNLFQHELLFDSQIGDFRLMLGAATEHEELEIPELERAFDLHSVFVQGLVPLKRFKLQGGVRAEQHSLYGTFYTGAGGGALSAGHHTFSLQYSQGFKAPSLYQLHAPPLFGSPIGNPDLVPERNHSWEGRWSTQFGPITSEIVVFQNRLSNLITFTNEGYRNQDNFIAEGLEVGGSWQNNDLKISSSFLHQGFREEETPVLRRPYNQASLGAAWFMGDSWELAGKFKWADSSKDVDLAGNVVKLSSFETVDLGVRYVRLREDYGVRLINVFDRDYEQLFGYSVMPRSMFVHYGRKF